MSKHEHRITSDFKEWADDKDPLKLMPHEVAKTPDDVREALKHLMAEYGAEVMAKVELGNTELLAELCEQATEELLDKHIQPLIEAAELRGISTGTTAYESTCEALIKEAKKEERAKLCTQCNYAPDSRYNVEAAKKEELKAVGKLLNGDLSWQILEYYIQDFLKGEMPDERDNE